MNIDLNIIFNSIKNRKVLFLKSLIFSLIASTLIFFIIPKQYSSSFHVLPEKTQSSASFGAAIGILGIESGGLNQTSEQFVMPDIVEELLKSRSFEKKLLQKSIIVDSKGNEEVILNYFIEGDNFADMLENDSKMIVQTFTKIKKDIETGIYSIIVTTNNPYASLNLANSVYNTLSEHRAKILGSFNLEKEIFLNQKIDIVKDELNNAESDLLDFVSKNSNYEQSPSLKLLYKTQSQNIDLLSSLYWKYKQDLEVLELEKISIIGGLVVIDHPYVDLDPIFPRASIILVIFLLLNVLINIPYLIYLDIFKK